jgi:hypothetical protein
MEVWLIHVISIRHINLKYINFLKVKSFVETLLSIIRYLFSRNSYVCPIWIFKFDTDQAQINSVPYVINI